MSEPSTSLSSDKFSLILSLKTGEELKMVVNIQDYLEKLVDHCNFHLSCLFRVKETNQVFTKVDFLSLEKPDLILEVGLVYKCIVI